jgi:hypothetical protein
VLDFGAVRDKKIPTGERPVGDFNYYHSRFLSVSLENT